MNLRDEFYKAYGDGVIRELEERGAQLTDQEKVLVVFASWDGLWYGLRVGMMWSAIAAGIVALVLW